MLSSLVQVIMRMIGALLLTKIVGNIGIFWGEILAWLGADIFLIIILAYKYRRII